MKIHTTPIAGLMVIETTPVFDERGKFVRVFCQNELAEIRPQLHWKQINLSDTTHKGTVRGMHFQYPPSAEIKLIRCMRGRVFDVAVDLRAGSPTLLQWHGIELDEHETLQFLIPEGFAHGYQALTDNAQLLYLHSCSWNSQHEGALRYDDPSISIEWPLSVTKISKKDYLTPLIDGTFNGVEINKAPL